LKQIFTFENINIKTNAMKKIIMGLTLSMLLACSGNQTNNSAENTSGELLQDTIVPQTVTEKEPESDSLLPAPTPTDIKVEPKQVIADGRYRFEMSFAEKQGQSMGEKVTIIIKGDSIRVVYEGDGNLKLPKGSVLDEGILLKHKSGVWIIAHNAKDANLEIVGGCSGGPATVDLKNKKFGTC
jgi:hypothetical protein